MKDELVTFETAKLAKEKGFNEPTTDIWYMCRTGIDDKFELESNQSIVEGYRIINSKCYNYHKNEVTIYAPTQSLLQKWLRDEHRIHITIRHYTDCPTRRFDDFDYDDELGSYGIEIHEPKTQDECDICQQ